MSFITPLRIESIRGTEFYKLTDKLIYKYLNPQGSIEVLIVQEGTETNFASVPKFIKFWIDNDDPHIRDAAVVHDDLYARLGHHQYTRSQADSILIAGMKDLGAPWYKRVAVYAAVRAFGGAHVELSMDRRRDEKGVVIDAREPVNDDNYIEEDRRAA